MTTITTSDGHQLYCKDWGEAPVVTLSHGWPLHSDAWDGQMLFLVQDGYRVIALDLRGVTMVDHSTGGGEVARYIGRQGTTLVAKAVLLSAVPPGMLKSADNPEGLPIELFDRLRTNIAANRSQFYRDFAVPLYGANRPGPISRRACSTISG